MDYVSSRQEWDFEDIEMIEPERFEVDDEEEEFYSGEDN